MKSAKLGLSLLICWSALAAGNMIWQAWFVSTPRWDAAAEHSWFQFVALFAWWLTATLAREALQ